MTVNCPCGIPVDQTTSGSCMVHLNFYIVLIVVAAVALVSVWFVLLWKALIVVFDNRRASREGTSSLVDVPTERIQLRTGSDWVFCYPILSAFEAVQVLIGFSFMVAFRDLFTTSLAVYSLLFILLQWLYFETTNLTVTDRRVILRKGLLVEQVIEIPLSDVAMVDAAPPKGWWQKEGEVGDIAISSTGQPAIEIRLKGVPRPEEIRDLLKPHVPCPGSSSP